MTSGDGYCDYEFQITTRGNYTWQEQEVDMTSQQKCNFTSPDPVTDPALAKRRCDGPQDWDDSVGMDCLTLNSYMLELIRFEVQRVSG